MPASAYISVGRNILPQDRLSRMAGIVGKVTGIFPGQRHSAAVIVVLLKGFPENIPVKILLNGKTIGSSKSCRFQIIGSLHLKIRKISITDLLFFRLLLLFLLCKTGIDNFSRVLIYHIKILRHLIPAENGDLGSFLYVAELIHQDPRHTHRYLVIQIWLLFHAYRCRFLLFLGAVFLTGTAGQHHSQKKKNAYPYFMPPLYLHILSISKM